MNIIFICTGNIFRSMTAEYCLKDYIRKHDIRNVNASSAATRNEAYEVFTETKAALNDLGINISKHKPTFLTKELLDNNDLIIAMSRIHQEYLTKEFNANSILFNDVCYREKTSVKDATEVIPNWRANSKAVGEYIKEIVNYIHDSIPLLVSNLKLTLNNHSDNVTIL